MKAVQLTSCRTDEMIYRLTCDKSQLWCFKCDPIITLVAAKEISDNFCSPLPRVSSFLQQLWWYVTCK